MYCRDYMRSAPVTVSADATIGDAIKTMIQEGQQHVMVVEGDGRFVGEIDAHQLAKVLAPAAVGSDLVIRRAVSSEASAAENADEVKARLSKHIERKVRDFAQHDLAIVGPDLPIGDVIMLLRGGSERMPVVENGKLVGTISMLSILERFHA